MKHIACLLCIAVLLSGCMLSKIATRYGTVMKTTHFDLEVDGQLYHCGLLNQRQTDKYVHAALRAYLLSEEKAIAYLAGKAALHEAIANGEKARMDPSAKPNNRRASIVEWTPNYFQVIDDESNEVLFEMPLGELGVHVNRRDMQFCEEKLKEAMTRAIRENVKP